jgi:hypothetical protein
LTVGWGLKPNCCELPDRQVLDRDQVGSAESWAVHAECIDLAEVGIAQRPATICAAGRKLAQTERSIDHTFNSEVPRGQVDAWNSPILEDGPFFGQVLSGWEPAAERLLTLARAPAQKRKSHTYSSPRRCLPGY